MSGAGGPLELLRSGWPGRESWLGDPVLAAVLGHCSGAQGAWGHLVSRAGGDQEAPYYGHALWHLPPTLPHPLAPQPAGGHDGQAAAKAGQPPRQAPGQGVLVAARDCSQ